MRKMVKIAVSSTCMTALAAGSAFAAENVALTGDDSNLWMWAVALILSGTILFMSGRKR